MNGSRSLDVAPTLAASANLSPYGHLSAILTTHDDNPADVWYSLRVKLHNRLLYATDFSRLQATSSGNPSAYLYSALAIPAKLVAQMSHTPKEICASPNGLS